MALFPCPQASGPQPWAPRICWAALLALAFAMNAQAQQTGQGAARGHGADWAALSPAQQDVLRPLRNEWAQLDTERRAKWVAVADRFPKLPASEQSRVQARMIEWTRMSPSERGQVRQNFTEAQRAAPRDRKAQWEAYNALPAEKRRELAARGGSPAGHGKTSAALSSAGQARDSSDSVRRAKPAAPTLSQAQSGATTRLMSKNPTPPAHLKSGQPKIAVTPALVDRATLLPKPGAQDAAAREPRIESPTP